MAESSLRAKRRGARVSKPVEGWIFYQGYVGRGRCRRWMRWMVNGDVIWPDWRRGYGPGG